MGLSSLDILKDYMTSNQAAEALGVSYYSLLQSLRDGEHKDIEVIRIGLGPKAPMYWKRSDVLEYKSSKSTTAKTSPSLTPQEQAFKRDMEVALERSAKVAAEAGITIRGDSMRDQVLSVINGLNRLLTDVQSEVAQLKANAHFTALKKVEEAVLNECRKHGIQCGAPAIDRRILDGVESLSKQLEIKRTNLNKLAELIRDAASSYTK